MPLKMANSSQITLVQLNFLLVTSWHGLHGKHCSLLLCHAGHADITIPLLCRTAITWQQLVIQCLLSTQCLAPGVYFILLLP
jgi:hypothetical protein